MRRLGLFIATGLGVGYIPVAPGTFGTLWGVLLFYLTRHWPWTASLGLFFGLLAVALVSSHFAEKALGEHDSSSIVIDEVVGYFAAILFIPYSLVNLAMAFLLFRLFDIWKPGPVRWIDRKLSGAWGVVLDDVVAGLFANLILQGILWIGRLK